MYMTCMPYVALMKKVFLPPSMKCISYQRRFISERNIKGLVRQIRACSTWSRRLEGEDRMPSVSLARLPGFPISGWHSSSFRSMNYPMTSMKNTAMFSGNAFTAMKEQRENHTWGNTESEDKVEAALLLIGDEILSGSVTDANTPWLGKFLQDRGINLVKVEIVPDNKDDIIEALLRLNTRIKPKGFIFTSGGIGPTPDDVTYEAISDAFDLKLEIHQPTLEKMRVHYQERGLELNEARLRMAKLPTPCEVLETPTIWVPLAVVGPGKNIFVLPGIPRLFVNMLESNHNVFQGSNVLHYSQEILTSVGEGDIAEDIEAVLKSFPKVKIGSYPNTNFDMRRPNDTASISYRVKLIVKGTNLDELASVTQKLCAVIQKKNPETDAIVGCSPLMSNDSHVWKKSKDGEWEANARR